MLAVLAELALRSFILGGAVWIGLNLLRVRNPRVHMMSWAMVLMASLSMPLLMHWMTVTITLEPSAVPTPETLWPPEMPLPEPLSSSIPSDFHIPGAVLGGKEVAVNWWGLAAVIYSLVSAVLLLRLALGVYLTWRLVRAAKPIREINESWATNSNVRVSHAIGGPVTFGSAILLPPQCVEWDLRKRQAVLAHEGAHVANMDFYVLLLASLNRAVFWFSPFAWWQLIRLAELAEIISDAQALEILDDRLSYAEMLLDLMGGVRGMSAGLEMARPSTIRTAYRANYLGNSSACEGGMAETLLRRGSRSAGCRRFCRHCRLQHAARICDRCCGRNDSSESCVAACLVLFGEPDIDLRDLLARQ